MARVQPAPHWLAAASPAADASPVCAPPRRRKKTTPRCPILAPHRSLAIAYPSLNDHARTTNTSSLLDVFFSSLLHVRRQGFFKAPAFWFGPGALFPAGPRQAAGRKTTAEQASGAQIGCRMTVVSSRGCLSRRRASASKVGSWQARGFPTAPCLRPWTPICFPRRGRSRLDRPALAERWPRRRPTIPRAMAVVTMTLGLQSP